MLDLPRILIVDHFDSYTLNLLSLLHLQDGQEATEGARQLAQLISERVVVLPHTHPLLCPTTFHELVRPHIDAIILSPGPGTPDKTSDFGAAELLLRDPRLGLPVLGVCLGHQGLATAFGGHISRAASVRHGLASKLKIVSPKSTSVGRKVSLLDGVPQDASVIRYNSLVIDVDTLPDCLRVTAWSHDEISSAPPPQPARYREASRSSRSGSLKRSRPGSFASTPLASAKSSPSLTAVTNKAATMASEASTPSDLGDQDFEGTTVGPPQAAIMALEHTTLPFHGVQFHPESIESAYGHRIMLNFLDIVRCYWDEQTRSLELEARTDAVRRQQLWGDSNLRLASHIRHAGELCLAGSSRLDVPKSAEWTISVDHFTASSKATESHMVDIFDRLFRHASPIGAVWFDSAREKDPHSRYSYMAVPSFALSYKSELQQVTVSASKTLSQTIPLPPDTPSFWSYINVLQSQIQARTPGARERADCEPAEGNVFRSGFAGYWGYEMKNESLGLGAPSSCRASSDFDAEFLFCNRVLAFDHERNEWSLFALVANEDHLASGSLGDLQNILHRFREEGAPLAYISQSSGQASDWRASVVNILEEFDRKPAAATRKDAGVRLPPLRPSITAEDYMEQTESARELIAAGESYELCMTNQFRGQLPILQQSDDLDHFALYCQLRARNPAPYSAFMRLPSIGGLAQSRARAILSTSPERFVSITQGGHVEMKPIKGTLARAGYGPGEEAMRAGNGSVEEEALKRKRRLAEDVRRRAMLSADVKERAENLMIVDLIRADLYSFCQSDSVSVPELMQVESYETVHQLVTTVVGQLKESVGPGEAIRRCFPPGSMTGAPKRRSVQLLERLELNLAEAEQDSALRARRGIYSGALGWIGVDGAADFSVIIRTLVADGDQVSIGAGGAITYLSDPEKEWQEVLDKVNALAVVDTSRPRPQRTAHTSLLL